MKPEEILICRIFEQAIEDYKELMAGKITQRIDKGTNSCYSIKDIEVFFGSKWCNRLLDMINSNLTGADVLSKVRAHCA